MGKEANSLQKSHKTQVVLYRIFLKLSMVGIIYSSFLMYTGSSFSECALPLTVAVCAAISYALFYYLYKSAKYTLEHKISAITFQIIMLLRLLSYFLGALLCLASSARSHDGISPLYTVLFAAGLLLCQLLHNNLNFFSNLSTFSENAAAGMVVICIASIYNCFEKGGSINVCIYSAILAAVLILIQELSFHFYNVMHHKPGKGEKKKTVALRFQTIIRNIMVMVMILLFWTVLTVSGGLSGLTDIVMYEKITKLLPICISIITVTVLLYNNFFRKNPPSLIRYNISLTPEEFKNKLIHYFKVSKHSIPDDGEKPKGYAPPSTPYGRYRLVEKALDYVTETMSKENNMTRDNGDPYYSHPIAVANILMEFTSPTAEALATSLLHDCVEDIDNCTIEFIEREFGEKVSKSVALLTKQPPDKVNYRERKNMTGYLYSILSDPVAAAVKTADRMNNNSTMELRPEKIPYKTAETKELYVPFVNFASWLYPSYDRFYDLARNFFSADIPAPSKEGKRIKGSEEKK